MDVFVARQPILNIHKEVVSYELLFRSNKDNYYNSIDGDKATLDVITNSFTLIGMKNLTNNKLAFINFTEALLLKGTPLLLPKDIIVVEILETVSPSYNLIEACKKLKKLGYYLALDDFVFKPGYEELIELADLIKIDFLVTRGEERKRVIDKYKRNNIKFLAEKVETVEDFAEALSLGYTYFQGYLFSKPTILTSKQMPTNILHNFELLKFINEEKYNFDIIESIVKKNVTLSYKLLTYINSASIGLKEKVTSIKQALALMGKNELIKWIALITFRNFTDKGSEALMETSIVRAKLGEAIAIKMNLRHRASEVFIMEMFSNIDMLLGKPMKEALSELPISDDIKAALLGENNIFRYINQLILSYERAHWYTFSFYAKKLNLNEKEIPSMYTAALQWANEMIEQHL